MTDRDIRDPDHVANMVDIWDNRDKMDRQYSVRVDSDPGDENDYVPPPATDEEIERSFDAYR